MYTRDIKDLAIAHDVLDRSKDTYDLCSRIRGIIDNLLTAQEIETLNPAPKIEPGDEIPF